MSLVQFQDHIYLGYKSNWFVWEPAWESFRPIHSVAWNGTRFQIDDRGYCDDLTSELYGYGSPQMKQVCDHLAEAFEPRFKEAIPVSSPEIGPLTWFFDRRVSLSSCAERDKASWKRMCRGRRKTCRKGNAEKFTRRKRVHS